MTILALAKMLHLLSMAVWIGAGLLPPWEVRRSLALEPRQTEAILARIAAVGRVLIAAGIATILTGFWLIALKGGFKAVPSRVHMGLGVTIIIFALGPFTLAALRQLRGAAASADDAARRPALARRFAMLAGLEEVLRVLVLIVMVGTGQTPT